MKLSDVLDSLKYGELKTVPLGGYGQKENKYLTELKHHINFSLRKLYERFPLLEKEIILETSEDKSVYILDSKYCLSNNPEGYIDDSMEEFNTSVILVLSVFDSMGNSFGINEGGRSIYLPSYRTIQIPEDYLGSSFYITYRASPVLIGEMEPDLDIPIPDYLEEALLSYINYRVNKALGNDTGLQLAAMAKSDFELLCLEVDNRNFLNEHSPSEHTKFKEKGWV